MKEVYRGTYHGIPIIWSSNIDEVLDGIKQKLRSLSMIKIRKSKTAGIMPGTPEWEALDQEVLEVSTEYHRRDVSECLAFFSGELGKRARNHDVDKLTDIETFHKDFDAWWERHPKNSRHHLTAEGGCPDDVNLIDVLVSAADGISAGVARNGKDKVYRPKISAELLLKAFHNTFDLLMENVEEGV